MDVPGPPRTCRRGPPGLPKGVFSVDAPELAGQDGGSESPRLSKRGGRGRRRSFRLGSRGVATVATVADDRLELFLTQCGLAWTAIPLERHFSLSNDWDTLYGDVSHWF